MTTLQQETPTVVYITSLGHSGSTLLDMLISAHSQATTVGEAKNLRPGRFDEATCSCAARWIRRCPFWERLGGVLETDHDLRLDRLDLMSDDRSVFERDNLALFQAVAGVAGRRVVVDSSKNPGRLRRLMEIERLRIEPIHLIRRAHGVVHSNLRKGRPWVGSCRDYVRSVRRTRAALRGVDHARLQYEELATDPQRVLTALMPRFGLRFEPAQLDDWARRERHDCGGNRMRRGTSGSIRLDLAWEHELGTWRKLAISALTLRARAWRATPDRGR